jgi:hypothetical protein
LNVPSSVTTRKNSVPPVADTSSVNIDGISTIAVKRPPSRRTASDRRRGICHDRPAANAIVAVPCRMMSGRLAASATLRSVWIDSDARALGAGVRGN